MTTWLQAQTTFLKTWRVEQTDPKTGEYIGPDLSSSVVHEGDKIPDDVRLLDNIDGWLFVIKGRTLHIYDGRNDHV